MALFITLCVALMPMSAGFSLTVLPSSSVADPGAAFQHPIHDLNCQSGNLDVLLQGRSTFWCWQRCNRRRARVQKFDDRIGRMHHVRFLDLDKSVTRFGPSIELKIIKGANQVHRICRKAAAGRKIQSKLFDGWVGIVIAAGPANAAPGEMSPSDAY